MWYPTQTFSVAAPSRRYPVHKKRKKSPSSGGNPDDDRRTPGRAFTRSQDFGPPKIVLSLRRGRRGRGPRQEQTRDASASGPFPSLLRSRPSGPRAERAKRRIQTETDARRFCIEYTETPDPWGGNESQGSSPILFYGSPGVPATLMQKIHIIDQGAKTSRHKSDYYGTTV